MCIYIINYQPGDVVHQPIIQLFGFDSIYHETILVNHKSQWPVIQGLFKIYIELESGENNIQLSTTTSQLSFILTYCPSKTADVTLRLFFISFSDERDIKIEEKCKQFAFLTKLVRCTLDEILYKQSGYQRSSIFEIEKQIHHLIMLKKDFEEKKNDKDIFKEIYRQIYSTDLAQDTAVKLVVNSSISPALTFASTFNNVVVFNLPKQFCHLPKSFDEFYKNLNTIKNEPFFYSIGAYLHELGHLLGLDHGSTEAETIMSSSKAFIDSGKDFFLITPRVCSIIFSQQCSCYQEPLSSLTCSYSNGVLNKQSVHLKSTCRSDIHCRFPVKFDHSKNKTKPSQCECNGQFQYEIEHCCRMMEEFNKRSNE